MKSLLLVACLGALALLANKGSNAYPISLIRVPLPNFHANYKITLPMAINLCGLDARCLLSQDIIGAEHPEVQREYEAIVRLAFLREIIGMAKHPARIPQDSSSEEVPEAPEVVPEVPEDPEVPEVPEVPQVTRHEVSDPDVSDSADRTPVIRRIGMIAIGNGLGTRRLIIFRNVAVRDDSSEEDADTPAVGPDSSDDNVDTAVVVPAGSDDVSPTPEVDVAPDSSDESRHDRPTPAVPDQVPEDRVGDRRTDDVSPTPEVDVAPDSSDESRHDRPTPAVPDQVPEDRVGDRSNVTPAPVPEVTTDLTNSIEQHGPRSTTQSSEEGRESLGDSAENTDTDQVEVFNPAKPERFVDFERFKYATPLTPTVRQID